MLNASDCGPGPVESFEAPFKKIDLLLFGLFHFQRRFKDNSTAL
jgi:hypothetical protein